MEKNSFASYPSFFKEKVFRLFSVSLKRPIYIYLYFNVSSVGWEAEASSAGVFQSVSIRCFTNNKKGFNH